MMTKEDVLKRRDEILAVARRYGASDVRIFGSVARGDADRLSDLDLLVRLEPGRTLLDQGGLLMELRELLKTNVDLIEEGQLQGPLRRAGPEGRGAPMRSDRLRLEGIRPHDRTVFFLTDHPILLLPK